MKTNQAKLLFLSILMSQVALACTKREVQSTRHEGPIVGDEVSVAPASGPVNVAALKAVNPEAINAKIVTARSKGLTALSAADRVSTLETLKPFVLNRTYFEDPRTRHTELLRSAVSAFHRTIIDLHETDAAKAAPWIEQARAMILSGCDGEFIGCTNLGFYAADPDAAKILQLAAMAVARKIDATVPGSDERVGHLTEYYRLLRAAFKVHNFSSDQDLKFLYLSRAREFAAVYEAEVRKAQDRKTKERRLELLAQHKEIFQALLDKFEPNVADPAEKAKVEPFINAFAPWEFSRRAENPFGNGATHMLDLAARYFLYTHDGQLSPSLIQAIAKSQDTSSVQKDGKKVEGLALPFSVIAEGLERSEPMIWKNLGLTNALRRDEYFFMVDRVFGEHLTPEDASALWQGSRKDALALLKTAETYVKIEVAAQIVRTNRYMSTIYSNQEWSSSTIFEKAIEKSYPLSMQWDDLMRRVELIQTLLDRNLKSVTNDQFSKEFDNVNELLIGLRRNVKFFSVYPNMMLMAYFMAELQYKQTVNNFYWSYEVDSASIIGNFFAGNLPPYFSFGNNDRPLKSLEILYAFLFAMKTDAFKAFSVTNVKKLDLPSFFEVVIGKYLQDERVTLEDDILAIRTEMRKDSHIATFLQACHQDKAFPGAKPPTRAQLTKDMKLQQIDIDLGDLPLATYVGAKEVNGKEAWNFFIKNRSDKLQDLYKKLQQKLDYVKIMTDLLDKHLEKSGVSQTERADIMKRIEASVAKIKTLRTEYLTEVVRWTRLISPCLAQTIPVEIERQDDLIEMEEAHLRRVHAQMKDARTTGRDDSITQANAELRAYLDLANLPSAQGYTPISEITRDQYVYGELDVLLRLRTYLKSIAPNVRVKMPTLLLDTPFLKQNPKRVTLPYQESVEDFVRSGLANFNDSENAYVHWLKTTASAEVFLYRIVVKLALFKLSPFERFNIDDPSCKGQENIKACPVVTDQITAKEIIDEAAESIQILSLTEFNGKPNQPKRDARVLNLLGMSERWSRESLRGYLLDANGDPYPLFDTLFTALLDERSALERARDFHVTRLSVGSFLFGIEEDFTKIMHESFKPLVTSHFARLKQFAAAISQREQDDAKNGKKLEFGFRLQPSGILMTNVTLEGGAPIYLARHWLGDLDYERSQFIWDTRPTYNDLDEKGR